MNFIISYIIIGITVLISYRAFKDVRLIDKFSFSPYRVKEQKEHYRILTHVFLHADEMHLLFNMMSFYFVGRYMEVLLTQYFGETLGILHFLVIYFGGAVVGTIYAFYKHSANPYYQSVGASGAVSSAIFAFIVWRPEETFYLFFAIPMKAYVFGLLFLAFEYFSMKRKQGRVAHDVHIISALFGVIYVLFINIGKGYQLLHLIF